MKRRPIVWSVAGSDSGAGAGVQADLRMCDAFGVHGCTAVAAITAQNSVAVQAVAAVESTLLDAQLAALAADLPPAAIKVGLLGSVDNLRVLVRWVWRLREKAPVALVVDPVWRASTGASFADEAMRQALCEELLPLADAVTPNRAEAAWLLGVSRLQDDACVDAAAHAISRIGPALVSVTGGDVEGPWARDHLRSPQAHGWLGLPRLATPHTHGSGCCFATAMACAFALGFCEADAAVLAKMAAARAIAQGAGSGIGAGAVRPQPGFALDADAMPRLLAPGQHGAALPAFPRLAAPLGLYAIVDDAAKIPALASGGVGTLQLRIKDATSRHLDEQVRAAVEAARSHGVRLFINDHWRHAIAHGAHGVHLGQEDLAEADLQAIADAGLHLGISTHAPWEVARALAARPSYIACGPIHATTTKDMPWRPQGVRNLAYWCSLLRLPVVAIGGMDARRAARAVRCGADGVALLSGLAHSPDPTAMAHEVSRAMAAARGRSRIPSPSLPRPSLSRRRRKLGALREGRLSRDHA